MTLSQRARRHFKEPIRGKVPEITMGFWIIKILRTGMGKDASDFLVKQFGKARAVDSGLIALRVGLYLQFRFRVYNRWVYWFAVAMVSLFGTMAADVMHFGLGVPYIASTFLFSIILAAVFWLWYRVEGTLSIESSSTDRASDYGLAG